MVNHWILEKKEGQKLSLGLNDKVEEHNSGSLTTLTCRRMIPDHNTYRCTLPGSFFSEGIGKDYRLILVPEIVSRNL